MQNTETGSMHQLAYSSYQSKVAEQADELEPMQQLFPLT